jgi:hypothetical protein
LSAYQETTSWRYRTSPHRCDNPLMSVLSTGYRGNATWRDMSEFAVHFTKPSPTASAYEVIMKILWEALIAPTGPFGAAKNLTELGDSQKSACFSEIPLDLLERLVNRRSLYGIGFRQDFLISRAGARVWYLDRDGPRAESFQRLVREAMTGGIDVTDSLWTITPFVDYPGAYGSTQYRFEWEREWRVPGGVAFGPEDVAFLFIPEELHAGARSFFEDHFRDNTGPAYLCPYVDPTWDMARIQAAFSGVATTPIPTQVAATDDMCAYCGGPTIDGLCMLCGNLSP